MGDDIRQHPIREPPRAAIPPDGEDALPLAAEQLSVSTERRQTGRVRVSRRTHEHEAVIDENLSRERVDVETVPIGREIDTAPAVRQEGDTTIIPVVEEIVITERRLVLKEEVRVTRVKTKVRHREVLPVRSQEAVIERYDDAPPDAGEDVQAN